MCSAHTVVLHLWGSAVRPFSVVTLSVLYGLLCTLCPVGVIGGGALGGCLWVRRVLCMLLCAASFL